MSRGTLLSAAVLAALAGTAYAAEPTDVVDVPARKIENAPPGMNFKPKTELNSAVWEVTQPTTPGLVNAGNGGSAVAVDIGQFPNFPPVQMVPNPLPINGIDVGWFARIPAIPGDFDYQVLFFQDTEALNAPTATTDPFYQNAFGGFALLGFTPPWGFIEWFGEFIEITSPIMFDRTKNFAYEVRLLQSANGLMWPGNATGNANGSSVMQPFARGRGPLGVGNSDVRRWNDATRTGAPFSLDPTLPVHFTSCFPALPTTVTDRRDIFLRLQADVNVIPPAVFTDLGRDTTEPENLPPAYDCNAVHASFNQVVDQDEGLVSWYRLQLDRAVARDDDTYLDIVIQDGPDQLGDVGAAVGLYNSDGQLVRSNREEGNADIETDTPATFPFGHLTFGRGRRANPLGSGYALDGRHGELPAGTYFIAVSGSNAVFGGSLFTVNATNALDIGSVEMDVISNVGSDAPARGLSANCANDPPIQPQVRAAEEVGDLTNGLTTRDLVRTGISIVRWIRFNVTMDQEVTPSNAAFLDANQNGTPVTDPSLGLYDNAGNLVAFDRDSGPSLNATQRLGQISIGGAASGSRPADGDGAVYANQNGNTLAPGTYWMAVGMDGDTESTTGIPMRFDAAGWLAYHNSGSRITVTVNIKTPTGCRIDYNNDGSVNPDDIGDFITDYYTDPPVPGPGGYAVPCPENEAPYDQGYKAAYNSSGAGQCNPPFSDNLGDFITDYFDENLCAPPA